MLRARRGKSRATECCKGAGCNEAWRDRRALHAPAVVAHGGSLVGQRPPVLSFRQHRSLVAAQCQQPQRSRRCPPHHHRVAHHAPAHCGGQGPRERARACPSAPPPPRAAHSAGPKQRTQRQPLALAVQGVQQPVVHSAAFKLLGTKVGRGGGGQKGGRNADTVRVRTLPVHPQCIPGPPQPRPPDAVAQEFLPPARTKKHKPSTRRGSRRGPRPQPCRA
jgi:hypothetical protein